MGSFAFLCRVGKSFWGKEIGLFGSVCYDLEDSEERLS